MREIGLAEVKKQIKERVGDSKAFLTFDIDFVVRLMHQERELLKLEDGQVQKR